VIFSRSISRSASPGSHFGISTMERAMTKLFSITGTSPVTWKSGTLTKVFGGCLGGSRSRSLMPSRTASARL
jgi:hypothetical protein